MHAYPITAALIALLISAVTACHLIGDPSRLASAVERHGSLSVRNGQIVDRHFKPVSLAGPSLFWNNREWGGEFFYNRQVVKHIQDDWQATIVRAAMGVDESGGYLEDPIGRTALVQEVVDAAIEFGMYVIIDWHSHRAEENVDHAIAFFQAMAKRYGHHPNVIYEIYNEPLAGTDWTTTVKPYAERVIAAIRATDPDNLIVVGTQSWGQDIDKAADDPITEFDNLVYSLHFYAGSHGQPLRDKAQYALDKGIALMITEWGTVNANGDGDVDEKETRRWMRFIRDNRLSHCNWALNSKDEAASQFKPGTKPDGNWTDRDLTQSGLLVKDIIKNWSVE